MSGLPPGRADVMGRLRALLLERLPDGLVETRSGDTIAYVVPHSRYPKGYHCDPSQPLPFVTLASQKNYVMVSHMGMYSDPGLAASFLAKWQERKLPKSDVGKSCIRLKKPERIPYDLIAELAGSMTVEQWIALYESGLCR